MINLSKAIYQEHIIFNCEDEVNKIVTPLLTKNKIKYCAYVRVYNDGSQWGLTNIKGIAKDYYSLKFYNVGEFHRLGDHLNKPVFLLWDRTEKNDMNILDYYRKKHSLGEGVIMLVPSKEYTDIFALAGDSQHNNLVNYFINYTQEITGFFNQFKVNAADLIKEADRTKIIIPDYEHYQIGEFYSNLFKDGMFENEENQTTDLSHRHKQILYYLSLGYSCKRIAHELNLSIKTIYFYLDNIKKKLSLRGKDNLLEYWSRINH